MPVLKFNFFHHLNYFINIIKTYYFLHFTNFGIYQFFLANHLVQIFKINLYFQQVLFFFYFH